MSAAWWLNTAWMWTCRREWRAFQRAIRAPEETQAAVLRQIIRANAGTEYGRQYGFATIRTVHDYQERVPLVSHESIQEAIERIAAGQPNVLTTEPVRLFEPTSGTTTARKLIPYTRSLRRQFQRMIAAWIYDLYRNCDAVRKGRAYWSISPALGTCRRTSGGILIGFDDDTTYLSRFARTVARRLLAVPPNIARLEDIDDFRYATLLWLLSTEDLVLISVWSPTFLTALVSKLDEWSERFCSDLRTGQLGYASGSQQTDSRRPRHAPIANPRRAMCVETILRSDQSLPEKVCSLWPRLALISCWADASAEPSARELCQLVPHAEIQPKGLLATEGCVSFPLVGKTGTVLALRSHFFEFQEFDGPLHSPEFGACRLAHELVEGRCYSVILTTGGGLYRYRLNDSVKVVGFEAGCPRVIFVGRFDRTSDLVGEKLSEPHVRQVLQRVFRGLGVVPKFAMVVPIASAPPHYRLYLQFQPPHSLNTSLESIAEQLQSGLNENPHYQHAVRLGQLGPIDVQLLDPDGESGSRIYERRCLSAGQRAGDIKPHALDSRDRWADAFDAAVQPPSDPRSMMPRSSRPLKRG